MVQLGLCINANGAVPDATEYAALGISSEDWVRTAVQGPLSLLDPVVQGLPASVNLAVALNNECREVRSDWLGWENACGLLAQRYGSRVKIVSAGNELDLWHLQPPVGSPDPKLTPAFAASLVKRASPILRAAGIKVAITSVASSSWVRYLEETAALCMGAADYADLHLYVKRLNNIPNNPDWQNASEAILQAHNVSGLPVICSEAGIKIDDAGGLAAQASWATGLKSLTAELVCYWCWHDKMASPGETGGQAFGARGLDGKQKPVWTTLQRLFGGPIEPVKQHATFVLGFKAWHDVDPALIGDPLENERGGVPGFSQQRTSRGILTAADINGRGWTLLFWDQSSGVRWLYKGNRSEQIA